MVWRMVRLRSRNKRRRLGPEDQAQQQTDEDRVPAGVTAARGFAWDSATDLSHADTISTPSDAFRLPEAVRQGPKTGIP